MKGIYKRRAHIVLTIRPCVEMTWYMATWLAVVMPVTPIE